MEMCTQTLDREFIPKPRSGRAPRCPAVHLTMPAVLRQFRWRGGSLKALAQKTLEYVLCASHPSQNVRIAVHEKKKMSDLEEFFAISPPSWVQLSVECQSESDLKQGVQQALESLGYGCPEWIGVDGSASQLGAFHFEKQESPALILYLQNHGARRTCDFLIPVVES